jgi:hypothetical protein
MQSYAQSLGLTSTSINHNIGCPTASTHNQTTLADLGKIYEAFQTGKVTTSPTWQAQFRSRMLNQSNYGAYRKGMCPVVAQEATTLGKSSAVATSFCNAITWIAKGGSYAYGSSLPYTVSLGGVSLTGLPFKSSGVTVPRYYVFGSFVDQFQVTSAAMQTTEETARGKLGTEALRPYIRAALQTW